MTNNCMSRIRDNRLVRVKSECFGYTFDDPVRTMVWLFLRPTDCILLYKDMGATREIAAHKRSLVHVVMGQSSLQLLWKYSAGRLRVVPYTSSRALQGRSS